MPCLNEAETLARCIRKARGFLDRTGIAGEVLVADNGSTDGSQAIAEAEGARVVHVPVRGYGAALFAGSMDARGRYVIMGDSDDSYDFSRLDGFVEKLREGWELVMGNRFRGGIRPGAMPWKNRHIGNPALTGIGRLLFRCPAGDFHCGLRGYHRDAFLRMDLRTTGMEFASEMVIKATVMGMRVTEVPTTLDPDGRSRPPHLRPWRDGWRHLRFMLLFSPRWLFVYPGLTLMAVGLTLGAALMVGPVRVGAVGLDVHTLLFCSAATLLGFQATALGVLSRTFAENEGLVPPDPLFARLRETLSVELGAVVGGLLVLVGLGAAVMALAYWERAGFGALNPADTLRAVVLSTSTLTLGGEILLLSFFYGTLSLARRPAPAPR